MKSISSILCRLSVILLVVIVLAGSAPAQTIDSASIDKILEDALKAWQVPGASLAIVKNDKVVHLKGYGVKEQGATNPVTPDTLFAIGSTSKAFTTTAMAMRWRAIAGTMARPPSWCGITRPSGRAAFRPTR